jgi:hypothetical protein
MVEQGKLPLDDTDDTDEVMRGIVQEFRTRPAVQLQLLPEALELLLSAIRVTNSGQGSILFTEHFEGATITIGGGDKQFNTQDQRTAKKYMHAIKQLLRGNLLEEMSEGVYEVTYEGYLAGDELLARGSSAVSS